MREFGVLGGHQSGSELGAVAGTGRCSVSLWGRRIGFRTRAGIQGSKRLYRIAWLWLRIAFRRHTSDYFLPRITQDCEHIGTRHLEVFVEAAAAGCPADDRPVTIPPLLPGRG